MQDKLIIKYIKKKNQKGMEILIDQYNALLTSIVRFHLGTLINYEEECVSDALLAIWDNIEGFEKDKNSFKNWICAIAKYKAIDYKRKYLNKIETSSLDEQTYYIDKNLLQIEIQEELNETLDFLSEEDEEIFRRYYLEDESVADIANNKKLAISSVHSKLSRGRSKIRKILLKEGGK
ncbi:sigma-70 family RNA polymerase sigma factor [Clostridium sp. CCUG 7971]|uniref:sigma-70 family RNA polymerase sigma factor n=1 Tax=Clostridium sp. CCUG 7971 TaxID=2811414 RepID=UPI001ABB8798|nr:sigma-70 family RNA polymerase sigma factor [Clostridium sp. CCUG 7971]MBO3446098.1 sigma-70 family RNA polymerase sigma factor [Clostridium sp. CCUG 7971]